jgi:hypothetical protein
MVSAILTSLKAVSLNSEDYDNNENVENIIFKIRVFINSYIYCIKLTLFSYDCTAKKKNKLTLFL